jgi:hypothetical protein
MVYIPDGPQEQEKPKEPPPTPAPRPLTDPFFPDPDNEGPPLPGRRRPFPTYPTRPAPRGRTYADERDRRWMGGYTRPADELAGAQDQALDELVDLMRAGQAKEKAARHGAAKSILQEAQEVDPARAIRILNAGVKAGLPEDLVDANLDEIEADLARSDFTTTSLLADRPKLTRWMGKSPHYAAAVKDNLVDWANLEDWLTRPRHLWRRSDKELESQSRKAAQRKRFQFMTPATDWELQELLIKPAATGPGSEADQERYQKAVAEVRKARAADEPRRKKGESEMEEKLYQEELSRRQDIERFIAGVGSTSAGEDFAKRFDEDPIWFVPFVGGFGELDKALTLYDAAKAVNAGTPTEDQLELLQEFTRMEDATARRGRSFLSKVAGVVSELPKFGVEIMATGGVAGGGKAAAQVAARSFLQRAMTGSIKFVGRSALQTAVIMPTEIATATLKRMANGEKLLDVLPGEILAGWGEIASESAGGLLAKVESGIGKSLFGWFLKKHPGATAATFQKALRSAGMHGPVGEWSEERIADLIRDRAGVEKFKWPSLEDSLVELTSFTAPHLAGAALNRLPVRQPRAIEETRPDFFKAHAELLQESAIGKASPEVLESLANDLSEDSKVEHVYVPLEEWNEYWKGQKDDAGLPMDPRAKAAEIIGNVETYDQAALNKTDIQIPYRRYVSRVATTEHNAFFEQSGKVSPRELTPVQVKKLQKAVPKDQPAAAAPDTNSAGASGGGGAPQLAEPETAETTAARSREKDVEKIRQEMQEIFESAGVPRTQAEGSALLHASRTARRAEVRGEEPLDVARRRRIEVQAILDPTPAAPVGAHESPGVRDSFERSGSGVDDYVLKNKHPVFGNITGEMEAAIKSSVSAARAGPIVLRVGSRVGRKRFGAEKIDEEHGHQIKAAGYKNIEQFVADVAENFDAIYAYEKEKDTINIVKRVSPMGLMGITLDMSKGIPLWSPSTGFIVTDKWFAGKRLLWERRVTPPAASGQPPSILPTGPVQQSGAPSSPTARTNQAPGTIPPSGAGGKPTAFDQPAYHGTPHRFRKFSLHKIGSGEGAQVFGWGLYFSGRKEVAEHYRDAITAAKKGKSAKGHVYTVEIPEDSEFLDFESTLKNQPKRVRDTVKKMGPSSMDMTGGAFYEQLAEELGPEGASRELAAAGIAGIKYLDEFSRRSAYFNEDTGKMVHVGEPSFNYVVFDDKLVEMMAFEESGPRGVRGRLIPEADRYVMQLTKWRDASTVPHELFHAWLEDIREDILFLQGKDEATLGPVQKRFLKGAEDFRKYLGIESWEQPITKEQSEKGARTFEKYLMKGEAPSAKLRPFFYRWKQWLLDLYRTARDYYAGIELAPEVRDFFDHLLATDEEIAAARAEQNLQPLFEDLKAIGMSDAQAEDYARTLEEAHQDAVEGLAEKTMAGLRKKQEKAWAEERKRIREQFSKELDQRPEYIHLSVLEDGKEPDGTEIDLFRGGVRFSTETMKTRFPEFWPSIRIAPFVTKDGKDDPDVVAEALGYKSPIEFFRMITETEPREQLLDRMADLRMEELHPELLADDEALRAAATDQVLNDKELQLQRKELEYLVSDHFAQFKQLVRRITGNVPTPKELKDEANAAIGQKTAREIQPALYERAAASAAVRAREALLKGDFQGAFDAKREQLLNIAYFREATVAVDEIKKTVRYVRRFDKESLRASLGKGDINAVSQIEAILDQYSFRPPSPGQERREQTLNEMIEQAKLAGFEPAVDPAILGRNRPTNYKDIPLTELRSVREAVESLEFIARRSGQVRKLNEYLSKEIVVQELVARAESKLPRVKEQFDAGLRTAMDGLVDGARDIDTELIPTESMIEDLDGGAVGPFHDYIWNRISTAQADFYDLQKEINAKVQEKLLAYQKDNPARLADPLETPVGTHSRLWAMSVAFNWGNESNADKLMRGNNLTKEKVEQIVSLLDQRDRKFMQEVWNLVNGYFPRLSDLHERVTGLPLPKIEARPFTLTYKDGTTETLAGGYFPVAFDPKESVRGVQQETGPLGGLVDEGYIPATIPSSARQTRTKYAAPLLLDFTSILQKHLIGISKDLVYREPFMDIMRLLTDQRIRKVLQDRLGSKYEKLFIGSKDRPGWLRHIANEQIAPDGLSKSDRLVEKARANVVMVGIGYKAATMAAQVAGLPNSIEYLVKTHGWGSLKFFMNGFTKMMADPVSNLDPESDKGLWGRIRRESGEMRHRGDTLDRDLRDLQRQLKQKDKVLGPIREWVARWAMYGIALMDRLISIPTYYAAKNATLKAGGTLEQAIHAGEAAVRRSQGAGGAKDLSEIQRKRGLWKVATMFYTPFAAWYGRMRSVKTEWKRRGFKYTPEAVARATMIAMLPSVAGEILAGRGPDDDDELGWWIATRGSLGLLAPLPMVRDVASAAESYIEGDERVNIRWSPVIGAVDKVAKAAIGAGKATFGDDDWTDELGWDIFESSGYILGLPTGQPAITGEYLTDLLTDEEEPDGAGNFLHELLFRRSKKERRGYE